MLITTPQLQYVDYPLERMASEPVDENALVDDDATNKMVDDEGNTLTHE